MADKQARQVGNLTIRPIQSRGLGDSTPARRDDVAKRGRVFVPGASTPAPRVRDLDALQETWRAKRGSEE